MSRALAIAALIIAAFMLSLWFVVGFEGLAPLPIETDSEAVQREEALPPIEFPASVEPSPEAEAERRVRLEESDAQAEDLSETALAGRVFDPEGNLVAGAVVALLVPGPGGPDKNLMAHVATDRDGVFALDPPAAMRKRDLVLIARHEGYRPACVPFRIDTAVSQQDLALHLERGHTIEGRIIRDGEPVPGIPVDVDLRWLVSGVHGIGTEAFWIDGRLEEKTSRTMSDARGRFQFNGLGPHEHRLHVSRPSNGLESEYEEQVLAPRRGLEIDLTLASIEVIVQSSGVPISGAWIVARSGERKVEVLSAGEEPTLIDVPADMAVYLRCYDDQSGVFNQTVTAPAKGLKRSVVFDLVSVERPGLQIHTHGARALGIDRLEARLIAEDKGIDTARLLVLNSVGDSFLWAAVPLAPGLYRLVIGPRQNTSSRYLMESSIEIDLPQKGRLEVEVALQLGGQFELDLHPGEHWNSKIEARLLDVVSKRVWEKSWGVGISLLSGSSGEFSWGLVDGSSSTNHWTVSLSTGEASEIRLGTVEKVRLTPDAHRHHPLPHPILAPGSYRLLVEVDGRQVIDREVVIRVGATTKEKVVL